MVSINPNFQGRVVGNPKTIATPQKEDAQPQVQTQQLQAPAQPKTSVQPQQATPDNESLLAFNGIKINKPEKPEKADEGVSLESYYEPDTPEEYEKILNSGLLKEGDLLRDPETGRHARVCKDEKGNLYLEIRLPNAK